MKVLNKKKLFSKKKVLKKKEKNKNLKSFIFFLHIKICINTYFYYIFSTKNERIKMN